MTDRELLQAIKELLAPLETKISKLEEDIAVTNMRIENQVIPAIQKLAEGHEMIFEKIDDKVTSRTEDLQDQIDVHSAAILKINRDIRELKKAQ